MLILLDCKYACSAVFWKILFGNPGIERKIGTTFCTADIPLKIKILELSAAILFFANHGILNDIPQ
jgi:hypothetical protein